MTTQPTPAWPPPAMPITRRDEAADLPGNSSRRGRPQCYPREAVLDLWAAGKTAEEISSALGMARPQAVSAIVKRAHKRGDARAVSRLEQARKRQREAAKLLAKGLSTAQVADTLGYASPESVRHVLAKLRRRGMDVPTLKHGHRIARRHRPSREDLGPGISTPQDDRSADEARRRASNQLLARLLKYHGRNPPDGEAQRAALHYARLCHYPMERRP